MRVGLRIGVSRLGFAAGASTPRSLGEPQSAATRASRRSSSRATTQEERLGGASSCVTRSAPLGARGSRGATEERHARTIAGRGASAIGRAALTSESARPRAPLYRRFAWGRVVHKNLPSPNEARETLIPRGSSVCPAAAHRRRSRFGWSRVRAALTKQHQRREARRPSHRSV